MGFGMLVKKKPDGTPYINPHDEINFDALTDDLIVCKCINTTWGDIQRCVSFGITELEDVIEETMVTTACNQCRENIKKLIDYAIEIQ